MADTEIVNSMPAGTKAINRPPKPVAKKKVAKPAKPVTASTALAKRSTDLIDREMSMFERFAKDKNIGPDKLDKLIDAQVRIRAINAEAAFNEAFAEMQRELPTVVKHGEIKVEGLVRSRYAKFEDIIGKIRPIMSKFGFSIRHSTTNLADGRMEIKGHLSHRAGHTETDTFTTKPDNGGKMNDIQRIGSAKSYGKRYTLLSLVGIATADEDDDGQATGEATKGGKKAKNAPHPPQAGTDGKGGEVITPGAKGQVGRLWAIAKAAGRSETELKMWLTVVYKIDSTAKILRKDYDAIIKALETPGPLPRPNDEREAGEEG